MHDDVYTRARSDAARGEFSRARQRLKDRLLQFPDDFKARTLLASLYRQTGFHDQAGRWAFATDSLSEFEGRAFARAYENDAFMMMRALSLNESAVQGIRGAGRTRLDELQAEAEHLRGSPVSWADPGYAPVPAMSLLEKVGCAGIGILFLLWVWLTVYCLGKLVSWLS